MKISIRFEQSNEAFTTFTVVVNGQNAGTLTMRTEDACSFHQILALGCCEKIDSFISYGTVR